MTIHRVQDGDTMTLGLEGRLDTTTSGELNSVLADGLPGVENLTLDLAALDYISSAGLRVLLVAQKLMSKKGGMRVINVNDVVGEVLEVTGFADILDIR